ncbi:insulinase family protein [bacterium]|nr:insulinase family protein [bacterium]
MRLKFFNLMYCLYFSLILLSPAIAEANNEPLASTSSKTYTIPQINLSEEETDEIQKVMPSEADEYFVVLKTGLAILVKEKQDTPVVSCRISVRAGSIYEEELLGCGVSHYLEHVVSDGTTAIRSEKENKEIISNLGGASNASTSYDTTTYFIDTTNDHWETAASLLFSYVTSCSFALPEILREKPVILQEFKLGENNPNKQLWQLFMSTCYISHPIRYPIIGYKQMFERLTRDDLQSYFSKRYQPQNMVLTVVGDINALSALKKIIKLTKDFKPSNIFDIPLPQEKPQLSARWVEQEHPAAKLTSMKIGFPSVALNDNDVYPLDVLAIVLGSGKTSRLYKALKDDQQLVLSANAFNWTPSFARGVFVFSANLEYKNVNPAIKTIWDVIESIKKTGVTEEELDRAKHKVIADYIFSNQDADDIASNLSSSYLATGNPHFDSNYVDNIKAVTLKDINRVAQHYFVKNQQTVAIIKPHGTLTQTSPVVQEISKDKKPKLIKLDNGMKIIIKKIKADPIVDFRLFLKGGLRYEDVSQTGISRFMASLLTRGTSTRSVQDIAEAIENIGGKLSASSGSNTISLSCSVLDEDVLTGLELLSDIALYPSFPQEEIEKVRKDILLAIEQQDQSWQNELMRFFKKNFFIDHPYKNDILGTKESINSLTKEDLQEFYKKLFVPKNMVLAVYGNFDEEEILKEIKSIFGGLPNTPLPEINIQKETGEFLNGNSSIEKTSDKYSASILLGFPGVTIYDKDKYALDVIDAAISGIGFPSGWLQESLRGNNRNLVYFVHAFARFGIDGGFFCVMTQTTMENYDRVISIIRENINKLIAEGLTGDEIESAKNMCITMHKLSLESPAAQAYNSALNETLGLGFDYDEKYPDHIKKVTKEEINKTAVKYFSNSLLATVFPKDYAKNKQQAQEKENE